MTDSQGFWSYVHKDDDADGGRIVRLAHDIVSQYEMLTNETIELFLDKDGIVWGNEWEQRIKDSLASVAFFVPILTPRYFASPICRNELNTFARRATELGVQELLLPVLYMEFPGLEDDRPDDDLVGLVRKFQWVDWRELRFSDPESAEYRRAVASMAKRLVEANRAAETTDATDTAISRAELADDEDGVLELMASFEEAVPKLTETTGQIGEAILELNSELESAGEELNDPKNQGFAKRLLVVRKLSLDLSPTTARISRLGDDFAQQLHDVDLGVRAIIARAPDEPESRGEFCEFFGSIRGMVVAAENGLGSLESMVSAAAPLEKLSRDIRQPLRDLRRGLTLMVEGRDVMRAWIALIDESGVECAGVEATGRLESSE